MINVTDKRALQRIVAETLRISLALERPLRRDVGSMFRRQFRKAADLIDARDYDLDHIVDDDRRPLAEILRRNYIKTATVFGERMRKEIEKAAPSYDKKGLMDVFWVTLNREISVQSLLKAKTIGDATKFYFEPLLRKGLQNGESNKVIADRFRKVGKIQEGYRAARVARTEVHSISALSQQTMARESGVVKRKMWSSALDGRTRHKNFNHVKADGETVRMDDPYEYTGGLLDYPGDFRGAAGNIINCRCVETYLTE